MHLRHMPPSNCNLINSNCSRSFLNNSWLLRPSNVMSSALPGALPNALHIFAIRYTTFPLTWPQRDAIVLEQKTGLGHQHGNHFVVLFCLGTPIWRKFWKRFLAKALPLEKGQVYATTASCYIFNTTISRNMKNRSFQWQSFVKCKTPVFSGEYWVNELGKRWWPHC